MQGLKNMIQKMVLTLIIFMGFAQGMQEPVDLQQAAEQNSKRFVGALMKVVQIPVSQHLNQNKSQYERVERPYAYAFTCDPTARMWLAIVQKNAEHLKQALEYGADVEAKSWNGKTPLYWACEQNNTDAIKLLVDAKANCYVRGPDGRIPLDIVCLHGNDDVIDFFVQHDAQQARERAQQQELARQKQADEQRSYEELAFSMLFVGLC